MKKIVFSFIIIILLFLLIGHNVFGESYAGQSAFLAIKNKDQEKSSNDDNNQYKIKELVIKSILKKYHSPLEDEAKNFIQTCQKYNLDCYLLPSIAGLESGFGRLIFPNSYNPFGWGGGYIVFSSWEKAIDTVGKNLRKNYLDKGAENLKDIGKIYAENPTWPEKVGWFMNEFKKEEEKIISPLKNIH